MVSIFDRVIQLNNENIVRSEQLCAKAKFLLDNYKCFNEQEQRPVKWNRATAKSIDNTATRVKIGVRDLSIEAVARKEFMAMMNKLTELNKSKIIKNIKAILRKECSYIYIPIIWDLMQRAPEFKKMYLEVSEMIAENNNTWHEIWNDYYAKRSWLPSDQLLLDTDYDEFCDYVKWKKRALAALQVLLMLHSKNILPDLLDKLIPEIVEDCNVSLLDQENVKKSDAILEQMLIIINYTTTDQDDYFCEFIKKWLPVAQDLKASSRFKIYDINAIIEGKMKYVFKVRKRTG
jgi:hypothetical protein